MQKLTERVIEFIRDHAKDDPNQIRLKGKSVDDFSAGFIADQIEARRKQADRLPTFCADERIIFPPSKNLEQSSSEITAALKSDYVKSTGATCNQLIDLTLGTGVDAFIFSRIFDKVYGVEPDADLLNITRHNLELLSEQQLHFFNMTAEEYLDTHTLSVDWIYIDPSRRNLDKRIYDLEDSAPNVVGLMNELLSRSPEILIKTSPMLDISSVLQRWNNVISVIIIAVQNECREVLYHLSRKEHPSPRIICLNVAASGAVRRFEFFRKEEETSLPKYEKPQAYLYEPNAAILKAGAFRILSQAYLVSKIAVSTHLYTSAELIENFPGRAFKIIGKLEKGDRNVQANIISRNFPMSADEIRKKYSIRDGGDKFVIAFSTQNEKHILLTSRMY